MYTQTNDKSVRGSRNYTLHLKSLLFLIAALLCASTVRAQLVQITAYGTVQEVGFLIPNPSITVAAPTSFSATVDFNGNPYVNDSFALGYTLQNPVFKIGSWETSIGTDFSWLTFVRWGDGSQEIEMESDDSNYRIGNFFLVTEPNSPTLPRSLPLGDVDLTPFTDRPLHFQWIRNSPPFQPSWFISATVERLTVTALNAVPEPSSWGMLGSAMIASLIVLRYYAGQRRRQRDCSDQRS